MTSPGGDATRREDRRQTIHLLMTSFVVALAFLDRSQALVCAGAAVILNWVVLPLAGADLRRPGGPFLDGVRTYPIAVLLLLLMLPLPLAAAAWAVLGVGDGASNLIGRRLGHPPLLGRADRSLAGTVAFVALAAPAAVLAWWLVGGVAPDGPRLVTLALAATAGAAAELLPLPRTLDDNLPIAAAAGLTLLIL